MFSFFTSTSKLVTKVALSGVIYIAGIISAIMLTSYINNNCMSNGENCTFSADLAGQLINLPFLGTAIAVGFPPGFCLLARFKRL